MMVKLNLLDENEIAKNLQQSNAGMLSSGSGMGGMSLPKPVLIGGGVVLLFYVCFLLFYIFGIRGPLAEIKVEFSELENKIAQLNPKVVETEAALKDMSGIKNYVGQFETFLNLKKNWSRILNVLSDELPDEILFERLSVSEGMFNKKTKTEKGLMTVTIPCVVLKIDVTVPEEFQSKISVYEKKIKTHAWLSGILLGVESSGLVLRDKSYTSTISLYITKIQE